MSRDNAPFDDSGGGSLSSTYLICAHGKLDARLLSRLDLLLVVVLLESLVVADECVDGLLVDDPRLELVVVLVCDLDTGGWTS